jgi:type IV/VI secretion system ImpK/VasF family protein
MKNEQWEAIHALFEKMEQLCGPLESETIPAKSKGEEGVKVQKEEASPSGVESFDIVGVRAEIRKQLDILRVKLAEQLAERDCYLVVFPIVAYFDEHIKTFYLAEKQLSWPPLQKELFQIDEAGELFYETVDDLLRKPQTIPFIYEVYYFCLSQGFQGKYADNPVKISEYMKKLREKIPVVDLSTVQTTAEETGQVKLVGSALWYYLASAAVLVLFYLVLLGFSQYSDLGFVDQKIDRPVLSQQQRVISAQTAVLPGQKGMIRKSINKYRTMMVRPIHHEIEESKVVWEEPPSVRLQRELEPVSQPYEEKEVTRAPQVDLQPPQFDKLPYIYSVQVSSFKYKKGSLVRRQELKRRGLDAWLDLDTRGGYYRVLVGKYKDRKEALALLGRLKERREFADALQVKVELDGSSELSGNI